MNLITMLSVIIPAHNEAKTIRKCISDVKCQLQKMKIKKYEIIVAEDGSDDGTDKIVSILTKEDRNLKLSQFDRKLGRGGALKNCSKLVEGDFIVYMDADLSTRLDALPLVLEELKKNDVVVGSRYIAGAKYERSFVRLLLSRSYNSIRMILFPKLNIKDAQCGFKGFRKDVFVKVNKKTKSNGWVWDTEFLIRAEGMGARIKEIPIVWKENKKTSVRILKDTLEMLIGLINLGLQSFHAL